MCSLEESYWHTRARANELQKKKYNSGPGRCIAGSGIFKGRNRWHICRIFEELFVTDNPTNMEEALLGIQSLVSENMCDTHVVKPTGEEIKEALF